MTAMYAAVSPVSRKIRRGSTRMSGAVGVPGFGVKGGRAQREAHDPATVSSPWLIDMELEHDITTPMAISSRPATLRGRLPKPMNAEDDGDRAEDARHEIRADDLVEQAVEADR
jgi:hypothetical protein